MAYCSLNPDDTPVNKIQIKLHNVGKLLLQLNITISIFKTCTWIALMNVVCIVYCSRQYDDENGDVFIAELSEFASASAHDGWTLRYRRLSGVIACCRSDSNTTNNTFTPPWVSILITWYNLWLASTKENSTHCVGKDWQNQHWLRSMQARPSVAYTMLYIAFAVTN